MSKPQTSAGAYRKIDVETASQGKLIIMLFNGAIQRTEEARRIMETGNAQRIHDNLIRAQEIITELRGALNMDVDNVAKSLDRVYEYMIHLLVKANIRKDTKLLDECLGHLTMLRDTWIEAFDKVERESPSSAPKIRPHGDSIMNVQG